MHTVTWTHSYTRAATEPSRTHNSMQNQSKCTVREKIRLIGMRDRLETESNSFFVMPCDLIRCDAVRYGSKCKI